MSDGDKMAWLVLRTDLTKDSHWFDGGFYPSLDAANSVADKQKAEGLAVEVKSMAELPRNPRLMLICWRWWPGIDPKSPINGFWK